MKKIFTFCLMFFLSISTFSQYLGISTYGSDNYIYLYKWVDMDTYCGRNCTPWNLTITMNPTTSPPYPYSMQTISKEDYLGKGHPVSVGPNKWYEWRFNVNVSTKEYLISPGFDCWYNCNVSKDFGVLSLRTAKLKSVSGLDAADNKNDTSITISWNNYSDIPYNRRGYQIYREDSMVYDTYGTYVYQWTDYDVEPGDTFEYKVKNYIRSSDPWGFHESTYSYNKGSAFKFNLNATDNSVGMITLSWNDAEIIGAEGYKIMRYKDGVPELEIPHDAPLYYNDNLDNGIIPGYTYKYLVYPTKNTHTSFFRPDSTYGRSRPNGIISGYIKAPSGGGVSGVTVSAKRLDPVPQDTTIYYYATTGADGYFSIENIYYYQAANFEIRPSLNDHIFSPDSTKRLLTLNDHSPFDLEFIDESSFSVSGRVIQSSNKDTCYMKNVEIIVNDSIRGVFTDENGEFITTVQRIDNYVFKPYLEGHTFTPDSISVYIESNDEYLVFEDTTYFTLNGSVTASCDNYIGQAELRIFSCDLPQACYDTTIVTDTLTGEFSIDLPARKYYIEMLDFMPDGASGITSEDVEEAFTISTIDLTKGDNTFKFTYRTNIDMEIEGFENIACSPLNLPYVEEHKGFYVQFNVTEIYDEQTCPADTGYIVVQNELLSETTYDTIQISEGHAAYGIVPGEPNVVAPYTKQFEAIAYIGNKHANYNQEVIVTGDKPRTDGATHTTVSPEIPLLILRDPPGDGSYSYLEEGTTIETAMRMQVNKDSSLNLWGEIKLGLVIEDIGGAGGIKGAYKVETNSVEETETVFSITNAERFSTSDNENITGTSGDVFAGAAFNLKYKLTDIINYNPSSCEVEKSATIIMGIDSFRSSFIYTEDYIKNSLIPELDGFRKHYAKTGNDSARYYKNQINVWQQILNMNNTLKHRAKHQKTIEFSGGTPYESSSEISESESQSIAFITAVDSSIAVEAGFQAIGSEINAGLEIEMRVEIGETESTQQTSSHKTGYVLSDDDIGDNFLVDICEDKVYGTPVFKLKSGKSGCPWEEGTAKREKTQISADTYTQYVNDPDGSAVFTLTLGNSSETDETMTYNLVFLQSSNPDGAEITLGGSEVQGGVPTPYTITGGQSLNATVTVSRGPAAYDYEGLKFVLYSGCDDEKIADTVSFSVHFNSPCSEISLIKPENNWVINAEDNNLLSVRLSDYDENLIEYLSIQYALEGSKEWITDTVFEGAAIPFEKIDVEIDFTDLPDGNYQIRALAAFEGAKNYSNITKGKLDREAPRVFGIPEPADMILDSGDIIKIVFTEEINCLALSDETVSLYNLTKDEEVDIMIGCGNNQFYIIPDIIGEIIEEDTFKVVVNGISDNSGNITENISWIFSVPSQFRYEILESDDFDNDSIENGDDNCPYSANTSQNDLDNDGIGDICDENADGDIHDNINDNCPLMANDDQLDIDNDGIGDVCDNSITDINDFLSIPFSIKDCYPNPFGKETTIRFSLKTQCNINMVVTDVLGHTVEVLIEGEYYSGKHEYAWEAKNLAAGIYYCTLICQPIGGNQSYAKTIKMVKTKEFL